MVWRVWGLPPSIAGGRRRVLGIVQERSPALGEGGTFLSLSSFIYSVNSLKKKNNVSNSGIHLKLFELGGGRGRKGEEEGGAVSEDLAAL